MAGVVEFGGESSGRFPNAWWGIEKRVCLLCGRECAVEAYIGVEGGVRVREAVEKGPGGGIFPRQLFGDFSIEKRGKRGDFSIRENKIPSN